MKEMRLVDALVEAMQEEMERDERVILMGEDVGQYGGMFGATKGLWQKFGSNRVMDTPISESGFTGAAVGMALNGFRPIVEIMFADFLTVPFDQIVNAAAKLRYMLNGAATVPLVVRAPYGVSLSGSYMAAAGPHHSQSNEAWFCHTAGLKVVIPSTPADAKGLLKASIRDDNPVVFFEQKGMYRAGRWPVPEGEHIVPLGKADVKREGKDVTIVAWGATVPLSLAAAETLAGEGISVEIVDPRTLVPLDKETILKSVAKTGRAVIVHEAPLTGGFGGEIVAIIADEGFSCLKAPIKRVAGMDVPIPSRSAQLKLAMPSENKIVQAVKAVMG